MKEKTPYEQWILPMEEAYQNNKLKMDRFSLFERVKIPYFTFQYSKSQQWRFGKILQKKSGNIVTLQLENGKIDDYSISMVTKLED